MLSKMSRSGVFWMVTSALFFSLMQLFVKLSGPDISVYMQVLVRNLLGIFIPAAFLKKEHTSLLGTLRQQPALLMRSLVGFFGLVTFFYATRLGNLADVTIVNRTGPFFTTLFSVLFLREKAGLPQWLALTAVFAGGIIAGNPRFDTSLLPLLLAMASAILNGIAYTLLAYFKDRVHPMTVVLHFSLTSSLLSLPFVAADFHMPTARELGILLCVALTGTAGLISITLAYRCAPASEISIYDQLGIVISILLGWLFLGQVPSGSTLLGGAVVMLASTLISFYNRRVRSPQHAP